MVLPCLLFADGYRLLVLSENSSAELPVSLPFRWPATSHYLPCQQPKGCHSLPIPESQSHHPAAAYAARSQLTTSCLNRPLLDREAPSRGGCARAKKEDRQSNTLGTEAEEAPEDEGPAFVQGEFAKMGLEGRGRQRRELSHAQAPQTSIKLAHHLLPPRSATEDLNDKR